MSDLINKYSFPIQAVCALSFGFSATMFGWKTVVLVTHFIDKIAP